MFDQLISAANIQCRLLIVENSDSDHHGYNEVVDDIVEFVLSLSSPIKRFNACISQFQRALKKHNV